MGRERVTTASSSGHRLIADRLHFWIFVAGCVAVTAGVLLHLPMFLMARSMGYRMAGMPMDAGMTTGMVLILVGYALAGWGLLPSKPEAGHGDVVVSPPEDAPLTLAHWGLMGALVIALVIDVMKPATLGFVMPGLIKEYGVTKAMAAWFPFSALLGTFLGSIVWGALADVYGRRATILLSAVMFVGTAICGAMPSIWWNVGMCFLMGLAAGGLLPVAYALLAEIMPTRHRGWSLVLVGGLGAIGGYLAASDLSALLQPLFSWRIMWFLNLPTGLILILMSGWIPESAKFLLARGHVAQAHRILKRFGSVVRPRTAADLAESHAEMAPPPIGREYLGKTLALTAAALSWSFINFGILLWLPNDLVAKGYDVATSSKLLGASALIAFPTVFVVSALYSRWSTKWSLAASIALTAGGLVWVLLLDMAPAGAMSPVGPIALLIVGSNALLAIVLPYTAETFPLRVRGRATGWVAGCSKLGGLISQGVGVLGLIPPLGLSALYVLVPTVLSIALIAGFGSETRGRDLRELEPERRKAA
jgi:putative MFS transporter